MNGNGTGPGLDLRQVLSGTEEHTAARDLIRPGKDVKELLMRTRLSRQEIVHVVRLLYKAKRFKLDVLEEFLLHYISAKTSEDGQSRKEVVQIATGLVVPSWGGRGQEEPSQGRFRMKERT